MSDDAILAAGTTFEVELDPVGSPGTFTAVPGVLAIGGAGEQSEAKDKTLLADTVKRYGAALPDTPDKAIKGQYFSTDADQRSFVTLARAKSSVLTKTTYPDGTSCTVTVQLLGFFLDEVSAEEWMMFTVPGKQSGAPVWDDPVIS